MSKLRALHQTTPRRKQNIGDDTVVAVDLAVRAQQTVNVVQHVLRFVFLQYIHMQGHFLKRLKRGRFTHVHILHIQRPSSPVATVSPATGVCRRLTSLLPHGPATVPRLWLTIAILVKSQVCSACHAHCVGVVPVHSCQGRDLAPHMTTRSRSTRATHSRRAC